MAYDDMEVIMYQILKYLYECMKCGVTPREIDFNHGARLFEADIPEAYWKQVMEELQDHNYIKGLIVGPMTKDGIIMDASRVRITLEGVQFLKENSGMQRAADKLGRAFEILLAGIVQALIR